MVGWWEVLNDIYTRGLSCRVLYCFWKCAQGFFPFISIHFSPFLNASLVPVVFRAPKNLTFGCQVWQQSDIIPWHSFSYMLYFILQCQRKTEQVFYQLWFFSLLAVWGLYTSQGILKYLQHFFWIILFQNACSHSPHKFLLICDIFQRLESSITQ